MAAALEVEPTNPDPHMNRIERWIVHSRWRWFIQRFYEIPILQSLGLKIRDRNILEVGCGTGIAARQLVQTYGARSVLGVDVDPVIIRAARRKMRFPENPDALRFWEESVTDLPFEDRSFFTVIGFGLLHHVPDWRRAVAEIARVTGAGGIYALDDFTASGLGKWYHSIFDHPREDRFTTGELIQELLVNDFVVKDVTHRLAGDVVFLVAEKI